jgi:hypothetical protein
MSIDELMPGNWTDELMPNDFGGKVSVPIKGVVPDNWADGGVVPEWKG